MSYYKPHEFESLSYELEPWLCELKNLRVKLLGLNIQYNLNRNVPVKPILRVRPEKSRDFLNDYKWLIRKVFFDPVDIYMFKCVKYVQS